jgi:hypothetical protein
MNIFPDLGIRPFAGKSMLIKKLHSTLKFSFIFIRQAKVLGQ